HKQGLGRVGWPNRTFETAEALVRTPRLRVSALDQPNRTYNTLMSATRTQSPPEHNVTGIDYSQRGHFRYSGPIIDFHAHVMITRPDDPPSGPPAGAGPGASIEQAETMLAVGREFSIDHTVSMCPPEDIPSLRERFGSALSFNGPIGKTTADEPDDVAYANLDRYLELGVKILKYWSAPRGRERGLFVDAPWRIEVTKR